MSYNFMKILYRVFFYFLFLFQYSYAQPYSQAITVIHGNDTLKFPWLGGWNRPRFQNIDLNQDSFLDLVVLDAHDQKLLTFLHSGISNSTQFYFAPQYIPFFPQNIYHWILLVDYNGDGESDIFTSSQYYSNVMVYKNQRKEKGYLSFELIHDPLIAEISPGTFAPLSLMDIPSITDVDYDGDVDILAEGPSSSRVELYRNYSNDLRTLDFRISSLCWGRFWDNADSILHFSLNQPCYFDQKTSHIGGTLLALSLNGDSLIDVLISDEGINNVVALYNGGNQQIANMVSQDTFFPTYDTPVNLQYFPAIFHVDVNGDFQKDLVFAPNGNDLPTSSLLVMNHSDAGWLYLNHGNNLSPIFKLSQKNFFYESTIDGGSYSIPLLFDEDKDGDLDFLLFSNHQTIQNGNQYVSQKEWRFYENIQSNNQPVFLLKTTNYHQWNEWQALDTLKNAHPTVADIDQDGDADFFIGHQQGKILFIENLFNNAPNYILQNSFYAGIQVHANSAPHFADIDNDLDLDLMVGVSDGTLTFCENIGNPQTALWNVPIAQWGNIVVTDDRNPIIGNAKPFWFDLDRNNTPNLLVGNLSGYVKVYEYLNNHQFQYLGDLWGEKITDQAAPWITDFNENDSLYFFVGSIKGGAYLFKEKKGYVQKNVPFKRNSWKVYPNPFSKQFTVESTDFKDCRWELWDIWGKKIEEGKLYQNFQYHKEGLPSGFYFFKIYNHQYQQTFKLIKIP